MHIRQGYSSVHIYVVSGVKLGILKSIESGHFSPNSAHFRRIRRKLKVSTREGVKCETEPCLMMRDERHEHETRSRGEYFDRHMDTRKSK